MKKLASIPGVGSYVLRWIHDFVCDRSQALFLSGNKSGMLPVESAVPQGSVRSPVLFLMYLNDLPDYVDYSVGLLAGDNQ